MDFIYLLMNCVITASIKVIKPSLDMLMAEIEKRYVPYGWEIVNVFHADKKYCAVLTGGNRHPDIEDRFF